MVEDMGVGTGVDLAAMIEAAAAAERIVGRDACPRCSAPTADQDHPRLDVTAGRLPWPACSVQVCCASVLCKY